MEGISVELVREGSRLEPLTILQRLTTHPMLGLVDLTEVMGVLSNISPELETREELALVTSITNRLDCHSIGALPPIIDLESLLEDEGLLEDIREVAELGLQEELPPAVKAEDHQV